MTEPVLFDVQGHVATITLNRPDSMNAINPPLGAAPDRRVDPLPRRPGAVVAIRTGAGERVFCAGADLKWRTSNEEIAGARGGSSSRPVGAQ
jgi:enoyl-CoA hydratase/carnithine racemase